MIMCTDLNYVQIQKMLTMYTPDTLEERVPVAVVRAVEKVYGARFVAWLMLCGVAIYLRSRERLEYHLACLCDPPHSDALFFPSAYSSPALRIDEM